MSMYTGSKGAIEHVGRIMAAENKHIDMTIVTPMFVDTEMIKDTGKSADPDVISQEQAGKCIVD